MKTYYYRHRPHFQPPGATLFVTFRLYGSLQKHVIERLKSEYDKLNQMRMEYLLRGKNRNKIDWYYAQQKQLIDQYDTFLHNSTDGPHYLKDDRIAQLVCSSLNYWAGKKYDLIAYCVMSNHVHVVMIPLELSNGDYYPLPNIMHSIKSFTAKEANKILGRKGKAFWTHESFDHYCRSPEETERIVIYVLNNPVKAGLVESAKNWPWSYYKYW